MGSTITGYVKPHYVRWLDRELLRVHQIEGCNRIVALRIKNLTANRRSTTVDTLVLEGQGSSAERLIGSTNLRE